MSMAMRMFVFIMHVRLAARAHKAHHAQSRQTSQLTWASMRQVARLQCSAAGWTGPYCSVSVDITAKVDQ